MRVTIHSQRDRALTSQSLGDLRVDARRGQIADVLVPELEEVDHTALLVVIDQARN
jgi:hypothetical protein